MWGGFLFKKLITFLKAKRGIRNIETLLQKTIKSNQEK
jgi:hypothetical protein